VVVFERGGLVFAFNFHWDKSYSDYKIGVQDAGTYVPVLNTDATEFGGEQAALPCLCG
jgi:1,4-alpha-glucan branching enzyme